MYEITVEKHFDAAHYLRDYQGKCENLHGHRYTIVVKVSASKLNDIGLAYDFTDLKAHVDKILDRYDHTCLNDVKPFDKINPSAENLASTIYKELKKSLGAARDKKLAKDYVKLVSVSAFETPEQGVTYTP
ncbi:MAG: 6-carboxytetrahydropterin synthase QueD [Dehalococcoidales bacterium]|jgi:6-pyruvoyltetrahydropterin/6-carboxytetrahydropterin synthase